LERSQLLELLADRITAVKRAHPIRVAIDGVDASGKTTLADELVQPLQDRGQHVIRASIDGFHNPRQVRYRQGPNSPQGYYQDSFNLEALQAHLLEPLGPDGNLQYWTEAFDFRHDTPLKSPRRHALKSSILLFDGIFLLRPKLCDHWDFKIFVEIGFDVAVERAVSRDRYLFATPEELRERYAQRYIPAQRLYLRACNPQERADVVVKNEDIHDPDIGELNL